MTKQIKNRIVGFKPALNSKMRTIRWAQEVWTPTGIVDVIRFEDYIMRDESHCQKIAPDSFDIQNSVWHGRLDGKCKIAELDFPNLNCQGCVHKRNVHILGILTTCFEVKISLSDFKSKNGHNFHGNRNYYVVPVAISEKVLPLVQDGIGLIKYYPESQNMVTVKECEHREVDNDVLVRLLYDAFKKWM